MDITGLRICVVGGGIGGLAAAIALRKRGALVRILEQAPEIAEVGAGLQISANGIVVLRALGIIDDAPRAGLCSSGTVVRDYRTGRRIAKLPVPRIGPTYYFHRADLIGLLYETAIRYGVQINLGKTVVATRPDGDGATIELDDGEQLATDCVIAADGGRSRLRAELNEQEAPEFTHQVAWRATIPWSEKPKQTNASLTIGPGRHVVLYPLRNHALMNIVAVEERSDWREEGWRRKGDPDDLRARFHDFGGEVAEILSEVQDTFLWALFLRPVASSWQNEYMAILGDAAHPTLPFMAQGACLALEDAWVLARSFESASSIPQALATYEDARVKRAQKVVAAAANNARNFHLRGPLRLAAQLALATIGPRLSRRYEWIYDYDVTA